MHICKYCKRGFEYKSRLVSHLDKGCNGTESFIGNQNKLECQLCRKKYIRKDFFEKHVEKCKQKLIRENQNTSVQSPQIINNYITNNNITNDNRVIVNQNIIQFNLPGKESISHIDQKKLLEILNKPFPYAIRELMRLIYFNEDIPENSKWCIAYPKDEYGALQYNHETENIDRWVTKDIVDENFENMMYLISPMVDQVMGDQDLFETLNQRQKQNINMFYGYFGISSLSNENPADFKNIKMMAFNNKNIPLELWENLKLKGSYKH